MSDNKQFYLAWDEVDWTKVHHRVRRLQHRIFKAKLSGEKFKMHGLQKRLLRSEDAKYLAVYQVTTLNNGRNTPGVGDQKSLTKSQKIALIKSLRIDGKAQFVKRRWIPKPGRQERWPLGIPTLRDRAKQALAKMALEPEWEAIFESNSYGFRPARQAQDAIEAIFLNLRQGKPKWVYEADIRKCFDRINHQALLQKLDTFPLLETQIENWLKAGIFDGYTHTEKLLTFPTIGTPQGGVISPLLANIALHGLENYLLDYVADLVMKPRKTANRGRVAKRRALGFIRYADDFVIIHENKQILEGCIQQTEQWLNRMGLELNTEKSTLRTGEQGFTFLGFQILQVYKNGKIKTKIIPSKENQRRLLESIRTILQNNRSTSSYELIRKLRPIIIGWGNYFKYCECGLIYKQLTHRIFLKLRAWVNRRDPRAGRQKLKEKYFPRGKTWKFNDKTHRDNWILYGHTRDVKGTFKENFLPHLVWIASEKYTKVKDTKSPYDGDDAYWTTRTTQYTAFSTRERKLLKRQKGQCGICTVKFKTTDLREVDHIIPRHRGGRDQYSNLKLVHKHCHLQKTQRELKEGVNQNNLQEPDEGKLSRPDLKTRKNVNVQP
uniref:Reverse transcriptase domain-containing protein n=1 Tax=Pseudobryopsis hainanensis TaxID=2320808 RepID=A0A3S5X2G4_9CHLO|nr:hypothetical protein [Pseudobryopsis hainanensis]